jgi:glucokinase
MCKICGNDITKVNGRTAFDAAKQGDYAGKKVVENYIWYLARGIASISTLLRPQAVILGGGVCNEGIALFDPLREAVAPLVYGSEIIGAPEILKAELGNDAGIIGAALLGAN